MVTSTLVQGLPSRITSRSAEFARVPAQSTTGKPSRATYRRLAASVAVLGFVGVGAFLYERTSWFRERPAASIPHENARAVTAVSLRVAEGGTQLILPAQLLPYEQTVLPPRVDGYVARWLADRGTRVK